MWLGPGTLDPEERDYARGSVMPQTPPYDRIVEETVDFAIFCVDTRGTILSWNRAAESIFRVSAAEAIGQSASVIFTPEDVATGAYDREMATASIEGRAEDDRWHVRRDGSRFWANGVLTALRNEAGVVESFVKIVRDESDARRLYETVRVTEEQFARIFFGNPAAIVVERKETQEIVFANEAFFETTGHWRSEVMGRSGRELHLWADEAERAQLLAGLDEAPVSGNVTIRHKAGHLVRCVTAAREIKLDSETCRAFTHIPQTT